MQAGPVDLYFEDILLGEQLTSGTHALTAADITTFGNVTRDHHPLHFDETLARSMGFDGIIAHGLFGLSLMEGLKSEMQLYEHTSIASLGWDKIRFLAPMYVGDILRLTVDFIEKRLSSRPGRGIVTEALRLENQHGAAVTRAQHVTLLLCRGAPRAAEPSQPLS